MLPFHQLVHSASHPYKVGKMSTSFCWGLTCDGLVSRPGGVNGDIKCLHSAAGIPKLTPKQGHNEGYGIRDHSTAMGSGIKILKIVGSGIKISKNLGIGDQNFKQILESGIKISNKYWDQGSKFRK